MKIRTTVEVSDYRSIVEGVLYKCNQNLEGNDDYSFMYKYSLPNGLVVKHDIYTVTEPQITILENAVQSLIPSDLNHTQRTKYLYYLGFRVYMAEKFGLSLTQIEIVTD